MSKNGTVETVTELVAEQGLSRERLESELANAIETRDRFGREAEAQYARLAAVVDTLVHLIALIDEGSLPEFPAEPEA